MDNHMITNLTGSDGYFTFNFFCESIVSSLHTVIHLMEDEQIPAPEKLSELPGLLAKIGEDLTQGYERQRSSALLLLRLRPGSQYYVAYPAGKYRPRYSRKRRPPSLYYGYYD